MGSYLLLALCLLCSPARADEPAATSETEAPEPAAPEAATDRPEDDTDTDTDAPTEPDYDPAAAARAEYVRLAQEMKRRAMKDHWDGVEHAYKAALATGESLGFDEHLFGVSAAFARGDVGTARERLLAAKEVRDADPEVIEGLWSIDTAFARVRLLAPPEGRLEIDAMPFNPKQAKAVGFARAAIEKTGTFEGYLPAGSYTLGSAAFEVVIREIGSERIIVDAREDATKRRRGR